MQQKTTPRHAPREKGRSNALKTLRYAATVSVTLIGVAPGHCGITTLTNESTTTQPEKIGAQGSRDVGVGDEFQLFFYKKALKQLVAMGKDKDHMELQVNTQGLDLWCEVSWRNTVIRGTEHFPTAAHKEWGDPWKTLRCVVRSVETHSIAPRVVFLVEHMPISGETGYVKHASKKTNTTLVAPLHGNAPTLYGPINNKTVTNTTKVQLRYAEGIKYRPESAKHAQDLLSVDGVGTWSVEAEVNCYGGACKLLRIYGGTNDMTTTYKTQLSNAANTVIKVTPTGKHKLGVVNGEVVVSVALK